MALTGAMRPAPYGAMPPLDSLWGPTLGNDSNYVGLIASDESIIDGVKDEFQTVGNTQLIKYVRQVMLSSVLTYTELPRQILVRIASNNKPYDLQLTGAKTEVSPGP